MDSSDINKISKGRRIELESDSKIKRELENVTQLQVAQDTAYWELKDTVQEVEATNNRLEQNIIELQVQYEEVSARYQDELRLRSETLEKVRISRELSETLAESIERLKATLECCNADQAALAHEYDRMRQEMQRFSETFTTIHDQARFKNIELLNRLKEIEEREAVAANSVRELEEKEETLERQVQEFTQRMIIAVTKLTAVNKERENLTATVLHEKQIYNDLNRIIEQEQAEFQAKLVEIQYTIENLEKQCGEVDEKRSMRQASDARVADLEAKLRDLKQEHDVTTKRVNAANTELLNKKTVINNKSLEIDQFAQKISVLERENFGLQAEAKRKLEEGKMRIKEVATANNQEAARAFEIEKAIDELRGSIEKRVLELKDKVEQKDIELNAKADAMTQLMEDKKKTSNTNAHLEEALLAARESAQLRSEEERNLKERITALEAAHQEKSTAIAEMTEILRHITLERERLQEQEKGLQSTIESVQMQLKKGEISEQPGREADVVLSETIDTSVIKDSKISRYDFFSEDSDANSFDMNEVNRRFEVLRRGGRNLTPLRTKGEIAMMVRAKAQETMKMKPQNKFFKHKRS